MEKEPKEIRILSRDEKKQWDMQRQFPDFEYLLGDVRDATRLAVAMEGVDYVFHAAALKQVGSCEKDPFEAVQTNIMMLVWTASKGSFSQEPTCLRAAA